MKTRITSICVLLGVVLFCVSQISLAGKKPPKVSVNKGLVAYWDFEVNQGDTVVDNVLRNGLNGEVYGAVKSEGAMDFDGVDDYIAIRGVRRLASLGEGSISVWFKFASLPLLGNWGDPSVHPIFYAGDGVNSGLIIEVGHSPLSENTKIYFTISTTGGAAFSKPVFCFDSNSEINEDEWYHFVAVVGDNFNTGYLNGEELVARKYNFAVGVGDSNKQEVGPSNSIFFDDLAEMTECWIGKGIFLGFEEYFDGWIDEVRIYDKPLKKSEVEALYEGTY